jgi:RNA polymerase sigma factor (sigma-70 family)
MSASPSPVPIETLLSHRAWVRGLAAKLVGDDGADDVEQQTWLAALRSPPRSAESVRGWLATVVRNAARQRGRTEGRRRHYESLAPDAGLAPASDEVVARADAHQRVVKAVMALDEPYRTTLLLRFFENLAPRHVAERMDVPVETVRTRTKRALARMRTGLDTDYGDRDTWRLALLPLFHDAAPRGAAKSATSAAAALTVGAGVMATSTKITLAIAGVVLLVTAAAVTPILLGDADEPTPTETAVVTDGGDDAPESRRKRRRRKGGAADAAPTGAEDVTDPASPVAPTVTITVRREDGGSVEGGTVLIGSDLGSVSQHLLDEDGRTSAPAAATKASLVVVVPGLPIAIQPLAPDATSADVVLPRGQTLAGVVRVNGQAPAAGFRLHLSRTQEWWYEELGLTKPLRNALKDSLNVTPSHIPVVTDATGRFSFSGLSVMGEVKLSVDDRDVHDEPGNRTWTVMVGDRAVALDLVRDPHLTGRVVRADGSPAVGAHIRLRFREVEATGEDGEVLGEGSHGTVADDDGRFSLIAPGPGFELLDLEVADADGTGERTLAAPKRVLRDVDVGDLVLAGVRTIELLVVDAEGVPVFDAASMHGRTLIGELTDGDGRTRVRLPESDLTFRVGGLFHGVAAVDASGATGATPLRVVLPGGTFLGINFTAPRGVDPADLRVRLRADRPLFAFGENHAYDPVFEASGASRSGAGEFSSEGSVIWFAPGEFSSIRLAGQPDEHSAICVAGLVPHVPFTLEVFDALGKCHVRRELRLEPRERLIEEITIEATAKTLSGIVTDAAGKPLPNARVDVRAQGAGPSQVANGPGVTVRTGADGRFTVTGILADDLRVSVSRQGFADWSGAAAPGKDAVPISLVRGRKVTITFAGTPIEDVWATHPGSKARYRWAEDQDDGTFLLEDLPPEDMEIVVESKDGKLRRIPCPVGADTIEVPAEGV